MDSFELRRDMYCRELIEERAYSKIVKDLLCLAYAFAIQPIISDLFVCSGCIDN